jgi:predicted metal-dependent hydrolase
VGTENPAMKKSDRIETETGGPYHGAMAGHPCYLGWFEHFNAGRYYEAHDVLEHLWLRTTGEEHAFFKGLIQLAGAFVHLKKQQERPWHAKDGRRLAPAVRLFRLAERNLTPYPARYLDLDLSAVLRLCDSWVEAIEKGEFAKNPWRPETMPSIRLTRVE